MPSAKELYETDSCYLKAEDLGGKEVPVTIEKIEVIKLNEKDKLFASFTGKEKGLVLNKTNAAIIGKEYGDDYNAWAGKSILLFPTVTEFEGKTVDCIRLRIQLDIADEKIPF